jgi:hypothetical protein
MFIIRINVHVHKDQCAFRTGAPWTLAEGVDLHREDLLPGQEAEQTTNQAGNKSSLCRLTEGLLKMITA